MKTGATNKRLEEAAFKAFHNPLLTDDEYGDYAEWAMGETFKVASALVPESYRIVSVEDLMRLRAETQAQHRSGDEPISDLQRFLDRIDALIAGDGE